MKQAQRTRGPAPGSRLRAPAQPEGHTQAAVSNRAMQRMVASRAARPVPMPAAGAEAEADRKAEQVLAGTTPPEHASGPLAASGQPLAPGQRTFFEGGFGQSLGDVRLHHDQRAVRMADRLGAQAFTIGSDIYLGAGSARMPSQRLLAHELAHVVQQRQGGPTLQPKLKITGSNDNLQRTMALLNRGLGSFYYVSIDSAGQVKIDPVRAAHTSSITGPTASQKAIAERLWKITQDGAQVDMTASAGSTTLVGSYGTGDFDITDVEAIGVGALIHEIEEQYQKQTKGMGYGSTTTGAHGEAVKAEAEVVGATRGKEKFISRSANPDGTLNAVVEIPHTWPDGTVKTMVMTITSNNVVSVTWRNGP
jgi:hypothetical protein